MTSCFNPLCGILTENQKFCSRTCAATYNNQIYPKRRLKGTCRSCGRVCSSTRKFCSAECRATFRIENNSRHIGTSKRCNRCKEFKDIGEFGVNRSTRDGLMYQCKNCNRERASEWLKNNQQAPRKPSYQKHGLTKDQYEDFLKKQKNKCPIDMSDLDLVDSVIDHDHACCPGAYSCGSCVRGVLCGNCNRGIGCLKEDVESLERAVQYLRR